MPNAKSIELRNIRFIVAIEDLYNVYIHIQNDHDQLEEKINYLLNIIAPATTHLEKKLIEFYQQEFSYLQKLKTSALSKKIPISELKENPFTKTPIKKKYTVKKNSYVNAAIYQYVVARHQFIFGADLPLFTTVLNEKTSNYKQFVPTLIHLAEQNFLPACHLLGCYLDDLDQRMYYINRAITGHYPLSEIYLYFAFFLTNLNVSSIILPTGIDETDMIGRLRNYIELNFTSAAFYKADFLKKLHAATPILEHSLTDKQKQNLIYLAQIFDRIDTGNTSSSVTVFNHIHPFIKEKTKAAVAAKKSLDNFDYFSKTCAEEILQLSKLVKEIENLRSDLCEYINELLLQKSSNFFKPEKICPEIIINYANAGDNEAFDYIELSEDEENTKEISENPLFDSSERLTLLIEAHTISILTFIRSLSLLLKALNEIISTLNADNYTGIPLSKPENLVACYAIKTFKDIVKNRGRLLLDKHAYNTAKLHLKILHYLEIFFKYTDLGNVSRQFETAYFSTALKLLKLDGEKINKIYAEIFLKIITDSFNQNPNPSDLAWPIRGTIQHCCATLELDFQNFTNSTYANSEAQPLAILISAINNGNAFPNKISTKNPAIALQIEGTLNVMEILATGSLTAEETATSMDLLEIKEIRKEVSPLPNENAVTYVRALRNILYGQYNKTINPKYQSSDAIMFSEVRALKMIRKLEIKFSHHNPENDVIFLSLKELENALRKIITEPYAKQSRDDNKSTLIEFTDAEEKRPSHSPHSIN